MSISARVQNRRLAVKQSTGELNLKGVLTLLVIVTAVALFYAFTSVRALNISYQVSRALETQRELRELGRGLKVEFNHLSSPQRLERAAARLNLAPPKAKQIRTFE